MLRWCNSERSGAIGGHRLSGERKDRLSILHVTAPARYGGLEQVVRALATGHRQRGHDVAVAAVLEPPDAASHPFVEALQRAGVEVAPVVTSARGYLAERRAVRGLVSRVKPHVVHTHGGRPDIVDAPVARALGIPTATTVHGFSKGGGRSGLYEYLQKRAFRRFHAVIAVSRAQAEELRAAGVRPDRLHLVPNAWQPTPQLDRGEARRFLGIPEASRRLGWVGRLTREKGADVVLCALARVAEPTVSLSIVGDGRERTELEALARRLGVADRVVFHGRVRDAGRLPRAFDAFVLSSRTEGTPIALFEAMAAGVPVVATAVGGVPDVVSEREAWLVPPEDPVTLALAINAALADLGRRRTRADAARERLDREFGVQPWLGRYETIYRAIARQRL